MDIFASIYSNPVYYLGVVMAAWGAFGFIYFLSGIFTTIHHAVLLDGDRDHMEHRRRRVRLGFALMLEAFFFWEILRLIADWFSGRGVTNGSLVTVMIIVYAIVIIFGYLVPSSRPKAH